MCGVEVHRISWVQSLGLGWFSDRGALDFTSDQVILIFEYDF
jgi:hypothetical protein